MELPAAVFAATTRSGSTQGSQVLLATTDEGQHWTAMSPDLTRNDKTKQGPSGGPITKDNTAVEYYDTIFTVDESPVKAGVIWVGSDDGLIHVTTDDGKNWQNVTPKDAPEWIRMNCIAASPFDAGTAYVAATMYLSDDFHPFLWKTTDYGKTWKKIVSGIPDNDFTRTIRPDPNQKGLLFAGTESHLYISYDDGDKWLAVPAQSSRGSGDRHRVPEARRCDGDRDAGTRLLCARRHAAGARARSSEIQHTMLSRCLRRRQQCASPAAEEEGRPNPTAGQNPPSGAVIYYFLKEEPKGELKLRFLDAFRQAGARDLEQAAGTSSGEEDPEDERPKDGTRAGEGRSESLCVGSAV